MKVGTLEIARIMGVTPQTIYNWKKRGMPCETEISGLQTVSRYDVDACKEWHRKQVDHLG